MPPNQRARDFFAAIVVGGLALTACSDDEPATDTGPDAVADAGMDMAVDDVGTDDADADAFVAIL